MKMHVSSQERREVLSVARRYRRDGYKVTGPDKWPAKPSFLGDIVPDLIAERDDDKVVIEVKRATNVRGSNDIVELAERIATQPGWRFELIAIPQTARISMPDVTWVDEDVRRLLDKGFLKPAFIMIFATIENLLAGASVRHSRNPANVTFPALVRELVVQGTIDEDTKHKIDDAQAKRNTIMHAKAESAPTRSEVEALLALCHHLQHEVSAESEA